MVVHPVEDQSSQVVPAAGVGASQRSGSADGCPMTTADMRPHLPCPKTGKPRSESNVAGGADRILPAPPALVEAALAGPAAPAFVRVPAQTDRPASKAITSRNKTSVPSRRTPPARVLA